MSRLCCGPHLSFGIALILDFFVLFIICGSAWTPIWLWSYGPPGDILHGDTPKPFHSTEQTWLDAIASGLWVAGFVGKSASVTHKANLTIVLDDWEIQKGLKARWHSFTSSEMCDPNTLVYHRWSNRYGMCADGEFQVPDQLVIAQTTSTVAAFVMLIGIIFSCLARKNSVFKFLGAVMSIVVVALAMTALISFSSWEYVVDLRSQAGSTVPIPVVHSANQSAMYLPVTVVMDFGPSWVCFLCVVIFQLIAFSLHLCAATNNSSDADLYEEFENSVNHNVIKGVTFA